MDLKQFAILRAIADTGSFNAAAEQLGLTQPAVSHQIRRLEEELGEMLVLRRRPRVALSPAGSAVLATAHRVLAEVADLKQAFSRRKDGEISGVLRVTASALGIIYLYGELLESFIAAHPRIELNLTATETPLDGLRQVVSRGADAAFVAFPIVAERLTEVALGETAHNVIVANTHPLAALKSVTVSDLRRHPFIRYKTGAGSRMVTDSLFLPRGGYPEIYLESNDTEFVKRIVALGYAAAITPRFAITGHARDRRLKTIPVKESPLRQRYGLVYRNDVRMRTLSVFAAFCRKNRYLIES
jgi:molybdate transport repressor ModE-like protein